MAMFNQKWSMRLVRLLARPNRADRLERRAALLRNKRARVSLTLRLICGYLLRSLLPFLTFILLNITGRLNVPLIQDIKYLLLYSCVTAVSAFFVYTAVSTFLPVRPC